MDLDRLRRAGVTRGRVVVLEPTVTSRHALLNATLRAIAAAGNAGGGETLVDPSTGLDRFVYGFSPMDDSVIVG